LKVLLSALAIRCSIISSICLLLSFFNGHFSLGASLIVAIQAVKEGANAEGMKLRDYIWRGHDPTSVAVMTEVSLDSQQCCSLCSAAKMCKRREKIDGEREGDKNHEGQRGW
jgi:hypothetical protein